MLSSPPRHNGPELSGEQELMFEKVVNYLQNRSEKIFEKTIQILKPIPEKDRRDILSLVLANNFNEPLHDYVQKSIDALDSKFEREKCRYGFVEELRLNLFILAKSALIRQYEGLPKDQKTIGDIILGNKVDYISFGDIIAYDFEDAKERLKLSLSPKQRRKISSTDVSPMLKPSESGIAFGRIRGDSFKV